MTTLLRGQYAYHDEIPKKNALDLLLNLDVSVDGELQIAQEHKQEYLDSEHVVIVSVRARTANSGKQEVTTHSLNANRYPMHARCPLTGFPFPNVIMFDHSPGNLLLPPSLLSPDLFPSALCLVAVPSAPP